MATRIHPRLAPAEPASPRLEPNAEMLLAPPPNLSKRLTASVHRSLPGWTLQVIVQRWTEDRVRVLITGRRDAGMVAPPAPPTGSEQAEKLERGTERALKRILEQDQPGTEWDVAARYAKRTENEFTISAFGEEEGKKNDPPTCIDGDVIFPGETYRVSETDTIQVNYKPPKRPPGPTLVGSTDHCVYFHYHGDLSPVTSFPAAPLRDYPLRHSPPAPTLIHANAVVPLTPGLTFVYVLTPGSLPLVMQIGDLQDWWVWW
ncbi:hypothetical protein KAK06_15110 [Ideonella sp. 4Y11]|uniref:Uncharacterized protein n=1 Tax=Ideonella aquatica TaxID=2824119 RepID=A0A941BK93_9BURK|nr:hypothetical protein [Ideonella aquatica]MBQ0960282.1 hypothetical protein [Ideonella aquatica]